MTFEKCRLCLREGTFASIFSVRDSVMMSTEVMSLAKIKIYPGDGLPDTICSVCADSLDTCMVFKHMCEKSDSQLRAAVVIKTEELEGTDDTDMFPIDVCSVNDKKDDKMIHDENTVKLDDTDSRLDHDVLFENGIKHVSDLVQNSNVKKVEYVNNSRKQQCFTCGKVLSSRYRLKAHLMIHTGERPFSCEHCPKKFSSTDNLKVHLRTHTGEKPLKCDVCGETFAQSAGLLVHRRKHTGQTPYKCKLCSRSFRTIGNLHYHIRRHTGEKNFECDTCGRAFITRGDLKQHTLSHTGEKPHVCCICGLRLTRSSNLKRHMQYTHNKDKVFVTSQCPSKMVQKDDFDQDKKEHAESRNVANVT